MRYSPDEIKAIILHYGGYDNAAAKLKINRTSLSRAAHADFKGKFYKLTPENYDKIYKHLKKLGPTAKKNIRDFEKLLETAQGHPAVKLAFLHGKPADHRWTLSVRKKYTIKQLKHRVFWEKIISKFYDKYQWRRGQWKR